MELTLGKHKVEVLSEEGEGKEILLKVDGYYVLSLRSDGLTLYRGLPNSLSFVDKETGQVKIIERG